MSQITLHIHQELAETLLDGGRAGASAFASVSRQVVEIIQSHGRRIAYAPIYLGDGRGAAMSVRGGRSGLIVEVDRPGTLLPGRGVVREVEPFYPRSFKDSGKTRRR